MGWNECTEIVRGATFGWGIPTADEILDLTGGEVPFVTRTSDITTAADCSTKWHKRRELGKTRIAGQEPHYLLLGRVVHQAAEAIEGGASAESQVHAALDMIDAWAATAIRPADFKGLTDATYWLPDLLHHYENSLRDYEWSGRTIATEQVTWMLVEVTCKFVLILAQHDCIRLGAQDELLVFDRKSKAPPLNIAQDTLLLANGFQLGCIYPLMLLGLWYHANPGVAKATGFGGARAQFWVKEPCPPSMEQIQADLPAYCDKCTTVTGGPGGYTITTDRSGHPRMTDEGWTKHEAENLERYRKHQAAISTAVMREEAWYRESIREEALPITDESVSMAWDSVLTTLEQMIGWAASAKNPSACNRYHTPCQYLGTIECGGMDDMTGSDWVTPEPDYVSKLVDDLLVDDLLGDLPF